MDANDRLAIEGLFSKLAGVEGNGPARDAGAEAFIRERIAAQPSAPYYMAQTIVVQDQALEAAQRRIAELEAQLEDPGQREAFESPLGRERPSSSRVPSIGPGAARRGFDASYAGSGGFLAGAAQTAMGVAGGVLLANMLGGLFRGDEAKAAEPEKDQAAQDQAAQDQAQDDAALDPASDDGGGFDFGGFDGGGFDF